MKIIRKLILPFSIYTFTIVFQFYTFISAFAISEGTDGGSVILKIGNSLVHVFWYPSFLFSFVRELPFLWECIIVSVIVAAVFYALAIGIKQVVGYLKEQGPVQ